MQRLPCPLLRNPDSGLLKGCSPSSTVTHVFHPAASRIRPGITAAHHPAAAEAMDKAAQAAAEAKIMELGIAGAICSHAATASLCLYIQ